MNKCKFPDGVTIKPDGINELDPCVYETKEVYANVIVEVCKCKKCGHVSVMWHRTDDTVEIPVEEWEDIRSENDRQD